MFHDTALARAAARAADPRPASAVSTACGLVGLAGLSLWLAVAGHYGMDGPYAALVGVAACALPMVMWAMIVDKVHLNPSTGFDWSSARQWRETIDISLTKLAGLWATWAAIGLIYATERFYWVGNFSFAMWCFQYAAPVLFVVSVPYIILLDRYAIDPRDGCWSFGAWLMGLKQPVERDAIFDHLRSWAVKGFFLAFMLAIVPPGFGELIRTDVSRLLYDPVALAGWLITLMFAIDVAFATAGYILALRPLDSHIRSASPYAAGWAAALICYPPFILMSDGGPFDYHQGTEEWSYWFAGQPLVLALFGAVLVALTAIYAWATVAFGFRFSNLTNRGILTHGPYAWSRHPAYLSKNLFWLVSTVPVLSTGSLADAARATLLMGAVAGVYYWRAKTEERHLGLDPAYQEYSAWMERNAAVPRFVRWLRS